MQKDANLVELEKCCQTHILLQNFVLIQPRTSPQKFAKFSKNAFFENAFFENAFFENAFFENASRDGGQLTGHLADRLPLLAFGERHLFLLFYVTRHRLHAGCVKLSRFFHFARQIRNFLALFHLCAPGTQCSPDFLPAGGA